MFITFRPYKGRGCLLHLDHIKGGCVLHLDHIKGGGVYYI